MQTRFDSVQERERGPDESVSFRKSRLARTFEAETFSRPGGESSPCLRLVSPTRDGIALAMFSTCDECPT